MTYNKTRTNNRFLTENFKLDRIVTSTEQSALGEWQLRYAK